MIWTHLNKYRDEGLLLLRVVVGLYLAFGHGWSKIAGGPEQWAGLGGVMGDVFGIGFAPAFWGFFSGFAEFVCALLVVAGLFFRPALVLIVLNMLVASLGHITGNIQGGPELAVLYGIVALSLIFIGPGRYSFDEQIWGAERHVEARGV